MVQVPFRTQIGSPWSEQQSRSDLGFLRTKGRQRLNGYCDGTKPCLQPAEDLDDQRRPPGRRRRPDVIELAEGFARQTQLRSFASRSSMSLAELLATH